MGCKLAVTSRAVSTSTKRAFLWYAVSVIPAVGFAEGLKLLYDVEC